MQICGHNASRVVSPITLAVVSEDGRGTSARIEIVEAARGVMQLAGRSGDVRSWRQSGRHMLVWSFSAFDPERTSGVVNARSRCEHKPEAFYDLTLLRRLPAL
jgi:hypothetical protein